MSLLSILFVGFLLGIRHATEADHLMAMATLATGQTSLLQTLRQGIAWGMGHMLSLLVFGGLVLWLGANISSRLEQSLEFAVGIMLIILGADVLRRLLRQGIHFHVHSHGPRQRHSHVHSHVGESGHPYSLHQHEHREAMPLRSLAVGMMHGMAGSAALVLLSLGAVSSWTMGIVYIALFGLGSVVGMALLSIVIALPLRLGAGYLGYLLNGMSGLVGSSGIALGLAMVYRIGFVEGLLLA